MPHWPPRSHHRPDRDDRLRLDRQGNPAAHRAPFRLRQGPLRRHRPRRIGPQAARRARHPVSASGHHPRQLPRDARQAADRRRRPGLLRQSVGRHLLARHHALLPRDRRALHRHRRRALARLLFRQVARRRRRAPTTRCARRCSPSGAPDPGGTTAVSCCGANPGMVSWFVKQALVNLAADLGDKAAEPKTREDWGRLAQRLGVKGVHIAERDTQRAKSPKPRNVFVNTWSVEGFLSEGMQPAELGWGTHEKWTPANAGFHKAGCGAAIYLEPARRQHPRALVDADGARRSSASSSPTTSRSRSPTISRCATIKGAAIYRPTCHYAYHPCDDAVLSLHELFGRAGEVQKEHHILGEAEILDGIDELGVLALRPQAQRLLVRLAAFGRGDARPRALPERHRHAGHFRRARRHGVGAGEPDKPASSKPTRWTTAAASKCRRPISAR